MTESYPPIPRMSDWAADTITEIEESSVKKEGLRVQVSISSYCQTNYPDEVEGPLFL